jgi:acyl-CoA ligase (AMP-forming) (exosortase A-associated)
LTYLLHHLLERTAADQASHQAIIDRDRSLNYCELAALARTCAAVLLERGLRRGDRVGIYLPKSCEDTLSIFGISMAGGVFVPINPLLKPPQVKHILEDCSVRFLITEAARWDDLEDALQGAPTLASVLLTGSRGSSEDVRVVADAFAALREPQDPWPCAGEDLATILYTSGSTGRPKGVMLSHNNLLAGSRIVCKYLGIDSKDRILSVLPFSFDYGLNQVITAVEKGATTVLLTFRFGNEIVRALEQHAVTGLAGVPTIWAVLTQGTPSFYTTALPHLRYLTNSGGAVPTRTVKKLRETLPHVDLVLMYGLTEAFRSTYLPPSEVDRRPASIGKAIPETDVFLVNEEGKRCRPGEAGILVHDGPTVSLGYWGRPEESAAILRPHPYASAHGVRVCYSGDLAKMDEEGYFYFVGRKDTMIKTTGYRVSPTEVEEVLMSAGGLSQAAVIGLPDPVAGEKVHAVVVAAPDADVNVEYILAHCARELPPYMVPRAVDVVAALPRSPNGKVDYTRLRTERMEAV